MLAEAGVIHMSRGYGLSWCGRFPRGGGCQPSVSNYKTWPSGRKSALSHIASVGSPTTR